MGPHPNVWAVIQGFIRQEADACRQINMSNVADLDLRENTGWKSLGEQTREQIKSVVGESTSTFHPKPIGRSWLTFSAKSNSICGCTHNQFVFL